MSILVPLHLPILSINYIEETMITRKLRYAWIYLYSIDIIIYIIILVRSLRFPFREKEGEHNSPNKACNQCIYRWTAPVGRKCSRATWSFSTLLAVPKIAEESCMCQCFS